MKITPLSMKEANSFVERYHRHNGRVTGYKYAVGLVNDSDLVGVAICGNPIARKLDDGMTIEIRRVCIDGTRNACSMLYGACVRVAKAMGYRKVITYTLPEEGGQV